MPWNSLSLKRKTIKSISEKFKLFFSLDYQNEERIESPGDQNLLRLIKKLRPSGRALDIGVGNGFNLITLARFGLDTYGIDINKFIINKAKTNLKKYRCIAQLSVSYADKMLFKNEYFDIVTAVNSIHYCSSVTKFLKNLKEIKRVLKPNGIGIIVTNHHDNWVFKKKKYLSNIKTYKSKSFMYNQKVFCFNSKREIREVMKKNFKLIHIGENKIDLIDKILKNYFIIVKKN